ncbi:hypothetical protein LTR09_001457 [Extremus antarcticus]|uniref:Uncharacterized protein n=1 Tax=Extremus antarcticus TaxID=702011 RepID=A0AAJ0GIT3_9PEZI|nr:hypothetical protein LTR09_001457 [Extremus antarcticus]
MKFASASYSDPDALFPPTSSTFDGEAAARRFNINLGLPPTGIPMEHHRVPPLQVVMSTHWRKIEVTSPLLNSFNDISSWQKLGATWTRSKVMEILLHTLTARESSQAKAPNTHLRESFTPLQLLATFKEALIADEPVLNFDFAGFMMSCMTLLREDYRVVESIPNENLADDFAANIIDAPAMLRSLPADAVPSPILSIVQDHIINTGGKYSKEAYNLSSGHLPADARPSMKANQHHGSEARTKMSAVLDAAGVEYAFSGRTVAAYHPDIRPEVCRKTRKGFAPWACVPGAETDESAMQHGTRVVHFGAALPMCIVDASKKGDAEAPGVANEEKRE